MSLKTGGGLAVRPARRLAAGGQGEVFEVPGPSDVVFKRYFDAELTKDPTLEDRLRVMVANRPQGWREAGSGHVLLTWPGDIVVDDDRFVGFLMPRVDPAIGVRLLRVSDPSDRSTATGPETWLRGFTWKYLVTTAANLALGVEVLHDDDVVIGDFNDANVVVTNRAQVTLLDCDSMQFTDPADGKRFLCRVFRPDFLAPELAGADLKKTFRPKSSDLFTLAVHVHQLLLEGEHPFRGHWLGKGDPPAESALAARGLWTHAGTSEIGPRRSAIGIDLLTKDLVALFRRAFVDGATAPGRRPDAEAWRTTLENLARHLTKCRTEPAHWYPEHHRRCPWCAHGHQPTALPSGQTALAPLAPVHVPSAVTVPKPPRALQAAAPSPRTSASVRRIRITPLRLVRAILWSVAGLSSVGLPFLIMASVINLAHNGGPTWPEDVCGPICFFILLFAILALLPKSIGKAVHVFTQP